MGFVFAGWFCLDRTQLRLSWRASGQVVHRRPDPGRIYFPAPAQAIRSLVAGAHHGWSIGFICLGPARVGCLRHLRSDSRRVGGVLPHRRYGKSGLPCLSALLVPWDLCGHSPPGAAAQIHPGFCGLLLRVRAGLSPVPAQRETGDAGDPMEFPFSDRRATVGSSCWGCFLSIPSQAASGYRC